MNLKLFLEAIFKFLLGVLLVGLLIFIPANTLNYANGWLLMGLLFIPMFIAGIIMMIKSPNLLKSRLNAKEKESEQKEVVVFSGLMFLIGFISAGLSFRYNFLQLPNIVVIIGSTLFVLSYLLYAVVLKQNAYLFRTIEVKDDQKVIDTGLYKIVRHPMYSITIILFLSMPLILGSLISFIVFLMYPLIIIKRIKNEELVLEKKLKGYKEYQKKVKYRIIPWIW